MALAAIPFGLAIGVAVGMLGGGGSILAVPVLVYVLGQDVHEATTASLVVVTAAALAGALGHAREGRVCWRHAGVFTAAATPGVIGGTALAEALAGDVLIGAFAVVMLAGAAATWRRGEGEDGLEHESVSPACPPLSVERDVAAGLLIGFLTGLLGVGGGFLIVPTLAIALALSMRLAIGTSLAIITATSALGLVVHLLAGRDLDVPVTASMTAACVVGALAGAAVAGRLPQRRLGQGFAVLLGAVGAYLALSVLLWGGPPSA